MSDQNDATPPATVDAGLASVATASLGSVRVVDRADVPVIGNGDLWPSCWSDDDNLYAAWGDGTGFASNAFTDIGVARISGHPVQGNLVGTNLATGDAVGMLWNPGDGRTRKPTGIACVDGDLYLAVQDLAHDFNDAPSATIARSRDKGRTWEWDRARPMFRDHVLTTIFFLDSGKDGVEMPGGYVYAYALDGNWRDSFSDIVPDPTQLFLARVPRDALQTRARWEWFAGLNSQREPTWSSSDGERKPVLQDARRIYVSTAEASEQVSGLSVISQGGVVYDAALRRYIYTSWTEFTYEFYEAPEPWGPFELFFSKDFGPYPWSAVKAGGYATTIPSKFISADGLNMYVQSNTFWGGVSNYGFSLRSMALLVSGS